MFRFKERYMFRFKRDTCLGLKRYMFRFKERYMFRFVEIHV